MSQTTELSTLRERVNQLAMDFVVAQSSGTGAPAWSRTLDELGAAAADCGVPAVAAQCAALRDSLAALPADSPEISRVAEAGLRALEQAVEEAEAAPDATAEPPAAAPAPARAEACLADSPELVADFVMEAREHLQSIESNVLALEQDRSSADAIHAVFRAFHTIKGIAGFLEFEGIRSVSHETETLLDQARNGLIVPNPQVIDVILESADYVEREIKRIEAGRAGEASFTALVAKVRAVIDGGGAAPAPAGDLAALSNAVATPPPPAPVAAAPPAPVTAPVVAAPPSPAPAAPAATAPAPAPAPAARAPKAKAPAPETRSPEPAAAEPAAPAREAKVARSVKVDTAKLDFLIDMVGEMVIAQSLVRHSPELANHENTPLIRSISGLSRITDEVQKTAMSMRMVPVGMLFQKMERLVRDLCRKSGKEAEFVPIGADTELDRNIVEELADPLMHMVRNSMDHGIETPDERVAAGKPRIGRVELRAAHDAGHVVIDIADDGRGMNRDKIVRKAVEKGIIAPSATLSDQEAYQLIFEPGFSTAEKVTDISGRGVGMDVVKRQIQKLRGRVEIQTRPGQGSRFRLRLPLTLAIIDGLIVAVGEERYIVPIFAVKEALRPAKGVVSTMEGRREIALLRGRVLPVVRLAQRFGVATKVQAPEEGVLIVTESQGTEYCLMIDSLIGKQEVVIKSLGETMRHVQGVAGGAILGDGRIGLILDMNALFQSGGQFQATAGK